MSTAPNRTTFEWLRELDPVQAGALRLFKCNYNRDMRFSLSSFVGIACNVKGLERRSNCLSVANQTYLQSAPDSVQMRDGDSLMG